MANGNVAISYSVVEEEAANLQTQATEVENLLGELSTIESSLNEGVWTGDDANFFRDHFTDFKEKMNIIAEDIMGIRNWATNTAEAFKSTEARNASTVASALGGM